MHSLHRQRGLSFLGWIALLLVVGFAVTVAAKIVPAYYDYYTILQVVDSVQTDQGLRDAPMSKIRYALKSRMRINNVDDVGKLDHLMDIERAGGVLTLNIDYEVRRHLLGNVDLVIHFQRRVGP